MLAFALFCLPPGIKNDTIAHYCAYLSNCILSYILISEKVKEGTREHKGQYGCKTPSHISLKERYIALMRAIVYDTFGGPDVLHLREVALPEPGPGQVRVAIYAVGTNPV